MLWKKIIGATGVSALALGGLLALAAPAQAEESSNGTSTCEGLDFTVYPNEDHRAWRAVIDDKVVWKSGDFGDDLGNDHQKLVDYGWTKEGHFDVHVKAKDAKHGKVTLQWWHVNPSDKPNGWTDWSGGEWKWERPADCPRKVEPKKPEVKKPTCDDPKGKIKIPDVKGVDYWLDGKHVKPGKHEVKHGKHEVKATPKDGHKFRDDVKKRWKFDFKKPEDCPKDERDDKKDRDKDEKKDDEKKDDEKKKDDELPVTGGTTGVAVGAALGLLTLGSGMFFLARGRRFRFTI